MTCYEINSFSLFGKGKKLSSETIPQLYLINSLKVLRNFRLLVVANNASMIKMPVHNRHL